jgi:hypothetical protein
LSNRIKFVKPIIQLEQDLNEAFPALGHSGKRNRMSRIKTITQSFMTVAQQDMPVLRNAMEQKVP